MGAPTNPFPTELVAPRRMACSQRAECLFAHPGLLQYRPQRAGWHVARVHRNLGLPAVGMAQHHMGSALTPHFESRPLQAG